MTTSRRVMIVEDQLDIAASLAQVCALLSHEVRIARNGAIALEDAPTFCPELVLLDIGLPDMSGLDVARALRAGPLGRDLVIVTLSGWSQQSLRDEAATAGVDRYLVKPATLAALREALALEHVQ